MIKTYKVQLKPNQVQHSLLNQAAGTSRWAYNWGLAKSIEHYNETGKFLLDGDFIYNCLITPFFNSTIYVLMELNEIGTKKRTKNT